MDGSDRRWIAWMEYGARLGCHQMPERSFFWRGYQFPVCARCTGVILGELAMIVLWLFGLRPGLWAAAALLVPMGVDWGLQYVSVLPSTNLRRLITGLLGGAGLTCVYSMALTALAEWIGKMQ